jgi:hypothetical protein
MARIDAGLVRMLLREATDRPDRELTGRTLPLVLPTLSEPV